MAIYIAIAVSIIYPVARKASFTQTLVLGNLAIFIMVYVTLLLDPGEAVVTILALAFRPSDLATLRLHTILTAMFLHADVGHVVANIISLYLLGLPLEARIRGRAFGALYFSTGIAATVIYGLVRWPSPVLALGASGAIMGIAGAFLALYPRERIMMFLGFIILPNVPVYLAVTVIAATQLVLWAFNVPGIAVEAHLAGLGAGVLLGPLVHRAPRAAAKKSPTLERLATTEELEEILHRVEAETVREVREAWIEHLLQRARCPQCQGPLRRSGELVTSECGWEARL